MNLAYINQQLNILHRRIDNLPSGANLTSLAEVINHSGSITFVEGLRYLGNNWHNALAYGMSPDETATNNTVALQNAINQGGHIFIPGGEYEISDTISISSVQGLRLAGEGTNTKLLWVGSDDRPAFELVDCRNCVISDLQIETSSNLQIGFRLYRSASATVVPKDNTLANIWMQGVSGMLYTAIQIGGTGATDQNNDFHTFYNVVVNNYRDYGVDGSQQASQSYGNVFINCQFLGVAGTSLSSYYCGDGAGFHFNIFGGMTYGNSADFHLGRTYQPYLVYGVTGEGSKRLLYCNHGTYVQARFEGGRWSGENLHTDNDAVLFVGGISQLEINQYSIGDGQSPTGVLNLNIDGDFAIHNSRIYSTNITPFSSDFPAHNSNNVVITDESLSTTVAMEPCYYTEDASVAPEITTRYFQRTSATPIAWLNGGVVGEMVTILAQNVFTIYNNYGGATKPIYTISGANITTTVGSTYIFLNNGNSWQQLA